MTEDWRKTPFAGPSEPIDPIKMARRDQQKALPRRFYTEAAVAPAGEDFQILLDGKPLRTPAKALFAVPRADLAGRIAAEWRAQTDVIDPGDMPLTRLVNSAIDGVAKRMEETAAEIVKFAETDLVCYRAGEPEALVAAQAAAWDSVLTFAHEDLGARFICAQGVIYTAQPEPAQAAVAREVEAVGQGRDGALKLAALSVMTALTGSVLLALAVVRRVLPADAAWAAAHVDEDFQARMWGEDAEARARRARRWREMQAAAGVFGG